MDLGKDDHRMFGLDLLDVSLVFTTERGLKLPFPPKTRARPT
jgi:hypothetical protein